MIKIKLEMKTSALNKLKNKNKLTEVTEKALDLIQQELLRNLQLNAAQANFKKTSGQYVRDIRHTRRRGLLHVFSVHPAALAIEYGFKEPREMRWLVTGNAIAFKTESGTTIIRKVTNEMIGRPSATSKTGLAWVYPPLEGKFIFTKSIKQTMPSARRYLSRIFKIIVED